MGPHGERIGVGVAPDRSALLGLPRFGLERKTMPASARSDILGRICAQDDSREDSEGESFR